MGDEDAAHERAEGDAAAAETPAQTPMARARSLGSWKTFVRIDRVAGMISAPPMPMKQRVAMSMPAEVANAEAAEPTPNTTSPMLQRALAAEPVTEAAGGEEQAGEDDRVAVDDPLELAVGGVQALARGGQRHVEDRVVDADHEEAEGQHGERPPAIAIDRCFVHVGQGVLRRHASGDRANVELRSIGTQSTWKWRRSPPPRQPPRSSLALRPSIPYHPGQVSQEQSAIDLPPMHELLTGLIGLVVGFTVGLTGMGGGALMTPLLVLGLGVNPLVAVSSDLVTAAVVKPIGATAHLRHGTVHRGLVAWLCAGSIPAAIAGSLVLHHLGLGAAAARRVQVGDRGHAARAVVAILAKAIIGRRRDAHRPTPLHEV